MIKSGRPLVTFALFSYNQEKYIREAVEAALLQDYSPLEIILSDDCSSDKTFGIMEEIKKEYAGEHQIVLIRNPRNLGVCKHVNNVIEAAQGEIIIMAAGDDISMPERTRKIVDNFSKHNNGNAGLFSNLIKINENGLPTGIMFKEPPEFSKKISDFKIKKNCWTIGASFSFRKSIYKKYGPINPSIRQEDGVLAFRCLLEGGINYINEPLVQYRLHDSNISQTDDPKRRLFLQTKEYLLKKSWLTDVIKFGANDPKLIRLVKNEYIFSFIRSVFFSIPFLGYSFNYVKICVRNIIK